MVKDTAHQTEFKMVKVPLRTLRKTNPHPMHAKQVRNHGLQLARCRRVSQPVPWLCPSAYRQCGGMAVLKAARFRPGASYLDGIALRFKKRIRQPVDFSVLRGLDAA